MRERKIPYGEDDGGIIQQVPLRCIAPIPRVVERRCYTRASGAEHDVHARLVPVRGIFSPVILAGCGPVPDVRHGERFGMVENPGRQRTERLSGRGDGVLLLGGAVGKVQRRDDFPGSVVLVRDPVDELDAGGFLQLVGELLQGA